MKFTIKHESSHRMRIHMHAYRMTYEQADTLLYYLHQAKEISYVKVYERTGDVSIEYIGDRQNVIDLLQQFHYDEVDVPTGLIENSGRELNARYQEKLIGKVAFRYLGKWLLPYPIRACFITANAIKYIKNGVQTLWQRKIEVPVLDATAIGVSVLRNDLDTAGSIMFLLGIGELLEEWTHKKSVDDLAQSMSLNISHVWIMQDGKERLICASDVKQGDQVVVHMGNVIPFDGLVCAGEAMVNQASLTGNVTKALSILMVDFSCALKLAMPISVLSAIRESCLYGITVKGGKYLEAVADADTIVFDKTGTLTKAQPKVVDVVSFDGREPDELLRIAACLEEHFPHSMAKAVVKSAIEKNLQHDEMHTKVEYLVAHGISTTINDVRVIIGSYHFIFEDEKCIIPEGKEALFESLPPEYSQLYLAIDGKLAAVICIEDPVRQEAQAVVNSLRKAGLSKIVMMTGDSERTASAIAKKVGVDEYYSEVLPEDKASFVEAEKAKGRKVIMIGDGINDSPALSAADAGIAISDGAEIAREIADITIGADNLYQIVTLKMLSDNLMKRIRKNYRSIVGFNTMLILLGVSGVIQPTTSAVLHNSSTLLIGLKSMQNLLD